MEATASEKGRWYYPNSEALMPREKRHPGGSHDLRRRNIASAEQRPVRKLPALSPEARLLVLISEPAEPRGEVTLRGQLATTQSRRQQVEKTSGWAGREPQHCLFIATLVSLLLLLFPGWNIHVFNTRETWSTISRGIFEWWLYTPTAVLYWNVSHHQCLSYMVARKMGERCN